jgi:hypothetical protein
LAGLIGSDSLEGECHDGIMQISRDSPCGSS